MSVPVTVRGETIDIDPSTVAGSPMLTALVSDKWKKPTIDRDPNEVRSVLSYLAGHDADISPEILDYYLIAKRYDYYWYQHTSDLIQPSHIPDFDRLDSDLVLTIFPSYNDRDTSIFQFRPENDRVLAESTYAFTGGRDSRLIELTGVGGEIVEATIYYNGLPIKLVDERVSGIIDIPLVVNTKLLTLVDCRVRASPGKTPKLRIRSAKTDTKYRYRYALSISGNSVEIPLAVDVTDIYLIGYPGMVTISSTSHTYLKISSDAIREEFEVNGNVYHLSWQGKSLSVPADERYHQYYIDAGKNCKQIVLVCAVMKKCGP